MTRMATLALLVLVATTSASSAPADWPSARAHVVRHLNGALDVLSRRNDLSSLTETQRANRALAIEMLIRYRDAGFFPENRDFADVYVPYFVDPRSGALCAVGHLMSQTGHSALVTRIAAADNHVRVQDLAGDAEVVAWLETYGLTLAEAARIQPMYGGEPPPSEPTRPMLSAAATSHVAIASGVLSALIVFPPSPRFATASRVLGAAASVTALFAGADLARADEHRSTATSALVAGGIGAGVAFGSWYFSRNAPTRSGSRWRVRPASDGRQFFVSVQRR